MWNLALYEIFPFFSAEFFRLCICQCG